MPDKSVTSIGVDVGGSQIRVAHVSSDLRVLDRVSEPVRRDQTGLVSQVIRLIQRLRTEAQAIGIGVPGRVRGDTKAILTAGYLDIAGLDLAHEIAAGTGLPVRVENDATMALIGEARARRDCDTGIVCMLTIGTGIGGAVILDGAPWYGGGLAGQFGHIAVAADGEQCNCGRRGCVETTSSGTALGRHLSQAGLPRDLRAEMLLERAEAGDTKAQAVVRAWAAPMRRALHSLVAVVDPKLILLGGGLGREMGAALAFVPAESPWFRASVESARLGDDAGVIGAGLAALHLRGQTIERAG